MTTDKRSVTTDALETLGTIIGGSEGRDAIHLAVEPVEAGENLGAGMDVGLRDGKAYMTSDKYLGIVDPFLTVPVKRGERFWLVVYPRKITSLRHVWEHPDFAKSDAVSGIAVDMSPSEKFLRDFAATLPVHFEDLLEHAKYWVDSKGDEYWSEGGRFEGVSVPDGFWQHYENVTGTKVDESIQHGFFSCSC